MKPQNYLQFGLFSVIIILVCLFIIQKPESEEETLQPLSTDLNRDSSSIDSSLIVTDVDTTSISAISGWIYEEKPDKMTSGTSYYAAVRANTLLFFKSPYDGGSIATLVLRNKSGITNAYVTVDKGQMLTRSYESSSHRVRFDDRPAEWYRFSAPSSGSTTLAFIGTSYDFIEKAKKSKKVLIELEFYQEGLMQMEFNISNLKWEH
jgi:hypothetical protein